MVYVASNGDKSVEHKGINKRYRECKSSLCRIFVSMNWKIRHHFSSWGYYRVP